MSGLAVAFLLFLGPAALVELAEAALAALETRRAER